MTVLLVIVSILSLCACGDAISSDLIEEYRANPNWGEGEKLVFYNKDQAKYHTYGLFSEYKAANPEEIGGIIEYSRSHDSNGSVDLKLIDARRNKLIADTSMSTGSINNGAAGRWAEAAWELSLDDRAIRTALQSGQCNGEKIAILDRKTNLFAYTSEFIPPTLTASVPSDIGMIISYDISPYTSRTMLYDASAYYSSKIAALLYTSEFEETQWREFKYWVETKQEDFILTRHFRGAKSRMGEGDKLIALPKDSQVFSTWEIPQSILAESPEEVGLIVRFSTNSQLVSGTYSPFNSWSSYGSHTVYGYEEVLTLELYNPRDDRLFETVVLNAGLPSSISDDTFYSYVSQETIASTLQAKLNDYLIDRHARSLIENKQNKSEKMAVWDERVGHYIAYGNGTLSLNDSDFGVVLNIIPDGYISQATQYSQRTVTVLREKIVLEIRNASSNALIKRDTITAYIPGVIGGESTVTNNVKKEQISDWITNNWNC